MRLVAVLVGFADNRSNLLLLSRSARLTIITLMSPSGRFCLLTGPQKCPRWAPQPAVKLPIVAEWFGFFGGRTNDSGLERSLHKSPLVRLTDLAEPPLPMLLRHGQPGGRSSRGRP